MQRIDFINIKNSEGHSIVHEQLSVELHSSANELQFSFNGNHYIRFHDYLWTIASVLDKSRASVYRHAWKYFKRFKLTDYAKDDWFDSSRYLKDAYAKLKGAKKSDFPHDSNRFSVDVDEAYIAFGLISEMVEVLREIAEKTYKDLSKDIQNKQNRARNFAQQFNRSVFKDFVISNVDFAKEVHFLDEVTLVGGTKGILTNVQRADRGLVIQLNGQDSWINADIVEATPLKIGHTRPTAEEMVAWLSDENDVAGVAPAYKQVTMQTEGGPEDMIAVKFKHTNTQRLYLFSQDDLTEVKFVYIGRLAERQLRTFGEDDWKLYKGELSWQVLHVKTAIEKMIELYGNDNYSSGSNAKYYNQATMQIPIGYASFQECAGACSEGTGGVWNYIGLEAEGEESNGWNERNYSDAYHTDLTFAEIFAASYTRAYFLSENDLNTRLERLWVDGKGISAAGSGMAYLNRLVNRWYEHSNYFSLSNNEEKHQINRLLNEYEQRVAVDSKTYTSMAALFSE